MSIGITVHFFFDDGTIKRIPYKQYCRITADESDQSFPEYGGKRIRCAISYVELVQRKPNYILRTDYCFIPFTDNCKIDHEELQREMTLAIQLFNSGSFDNIIHISHHYARNRIKKEFSWEPTPDELNFIISDVFSTKK